MFDWFLSKRLERLGRRANPDPAFVRALELRLRQEMKPQPRLWTSWRGAVGFATTAVLLLVGTGGFAYSAESVLPEHPLYPLRQALERVEDRLALNPEQRAEVRLKHVDRRLRERLLLNRLSKPVTEEQMHNFVANVEASIEANGVLPEKEQVEFDATTAKIENVYTDSVVVAREQEPDQVEKEKIDTIIETQTTILEQHVGSLEEPRKEQFQTITERQRLLREQHKLEREGLPPLDQAQLRRLMELRQRNALLGNTPTSSVTGTR